MTLRSRKLEAKICRSSSIIHTRIVFPRDYLVDYSRSTERSRLAEDRTYRSRGGGWASARARREWVGPKGQRPGSTSRPRVRGRSTGTREGSRPSCRSTLFRGTGVARWKERCDASEWSSSTERRERRVR